MRARDIMSRPVYTVAPTDTIEQAAALLAQNKVTAAPVIAADGSLIGMVSDGDLLWHRVPGDPTARARRDVPSVATPRPSVVVDVMTTNPLSMPPDADVADVAELMLDRDVRSVPIVDHGAVVGIVSRRDILRTVVRTDEVLCHEVQHRLDEYAGGVRRWTATVARGVATIDGDFDDETERIVVGVMARTVPGVSEARLAQPA